MNAPSIEVIKSACETLAEGDRVLASAFKIVGVPEWRTSTADYQALAKMVTFQLISTKAAATIWQRVQTRFPNVTAESFDVSDEDALRDCGLSGPKIRSLGLIAAALNTGSLDLRRVLASPINEARKELLAVGGIGPWTADLFLLYSGVLDAFPQGDVGVMEAHKRLSEADVRMTPKAFTAHAEKWRPFRGVAVHLLWGYLNIQRGQAATA